MLVPVHHDECAAVLTSGCILYCSLVVPEGQRREDGGHREPGREQQDLGRVSAPPLVWMTIALPLIVWSLLQSRHSACVCDVVLVCHLHVLLL
jgi:hypothetical protein